MEVETLSPITVQAEVKKYTLVGDDIYVKRYTNDTIPDWYRSIISNILSTDNSITDLESAIDYLSSLPAGYNQLITSLQNKDLLIDTSLESLVTRDAEKSAAIASLWTTKTDSTSAQAIALNVIGSYFNDGSAGSWFSNQISTYASNIAANASSISTLAASLNGQDVRIDTVESVNISQATDLNLIKTIDIPALQSQIDGSITTWFDNGIPTLLNTPANAWTDVPTKNIHLGDVYYDRATGYAYRFAHEDIVDTPDMGLIYTWIRITDTDVIKALADAATAQSTADGKSVVQYQATAPTGKTAADIGDTWVNSNTNIISTWNGTSWVLPQTTWSANASKLITSPDGSVTGWSFGDGSNTKSYFQIQATNFKISDGTTGYTPFSIMGGNIYLNGKVEFSNINNTPPINKTYSQTSAPTSGMIMGDVWIDTDDNNKVYTYTTTGWTPPPSGVKTYAQTSAPTSGMIVGDLWYDTDNNNLVSRYSGSVWVGVLTDPALYINANTTTINGGKITAGSITVGEINVVNLKASSLFVDNVLVNGEVKSSNFSAITGAGFRLKSNAAGTYADPTIYGAYIRGGYIYGATLDSGTMNVRLLNVITDGGQATTAFFTENPEYINNSTYRYNIYSYNSTDVTKKKLCQNTATTVAVGSGGRFLSGIDYSYFADIEAGAYGVTISIYVGTTLIGTASFGAYASGQYKSAAGLTFYWVNSGSGDVADWIVVKKDCTLTMQGNGKLEFRTYNLYSISPSITVYNI